MNIINNAVAELFFRIPQPLLQEAFKDPTHLWQQAPFNLDQAIINKVIKARVLIAANLVTGEAINVYLHAVTPIFRDQYCVIYRVPAEQTQGREILSVLSISYMPYSNNMGTYGLGQSNIGPLYSNDTGATFQQMAESYSSIPHTGSASADITGHNTIRITDPMRSMMGYILRCYVTNERWLSNFNPRSHPAFFRLVELAVKSYIYNTLRVRIDEAFLQGGQNLGVFKTIVEEYADAEEMYQTYLREDFSAVSHMNNRNQHERFLRMQIPIGL